MVKMSGGVVQLLLPCKLVLTTLRDILHFLSSFCVVFVWFLCGFVEAFLSPIFPFLLMLRSPLLLWKIPHDKVVNFDPLQTR